MPDGRDEADNGEQRTGDKERDEYRSPDPRGAYDGMLRGDEWIRPGNVKHGAVSLRGGDEPQVVVDILRALPEIRSRVPADLKVLYGYPAACLITEVKAEAPYGLVGAVKPYREVRELILLKIEILPYGVVLSIVPVEALHDIEDLGLHNAGAIRPDVGAYHVGGIEGEEVKRPGKEAYRKRDIDKEQRVKE